MNLLDSSQRAPTANGVASLSTQPAAALNASPPLTPRMAPWMHAVLADREGLTDQFARYGSPLNIHAREPFLANYARYRQVLEDFDLQHGVYFARKANKCRAFVQAAHLGEFGVDTASFRELEECLALGCHPDRLVVTAAIKDERLVTLAVAHGVLIILDNLDECSLVQRIAHSLGTAAQVGIRVGGFTYAGELLYSRFGFPLDEVVPLVTDFLPQEFPALHYRGLHFHLNGYSTAQRGAALLQTIACADRLREQDVTTEFVDIGGGFLVRYLDRQEEWEHFHQALRAAVQGERPPITFQNMGLGLTLIDGRVHGAPTVYPYYNDRPQATFLTEVLATTDGSGQTAAALLRARGIELRMEPGRSLLDQAGMTIARVAFRKWDLRGDLLVGLEMNRTQMFSSSADFLLDPVVMYQDGQDRDAAHLEMTEDAAVAAYFVGAYCLEQELILKRKIALKRIPEVGDWVCFPNTAGYMMHFFESEAHLFELAANLVAVAAAGRGSPYHYELDVAPECSPLLAGA